MKHARRTVAALFALALAGCSGGEFIGPAGRPASPAPAASSTPSTSAPASSSPTAAPAATATPAPNATPTTRATAFPAPTTSPVGATPAPSPTQTPAPAPTASLVPTPAPSPVPTPSATPTAGTSLYVANEQEISVFPLAANGNFAPSFSIANSAIYDTSDAAMDAAGDLYVANYTTNINTNAPGNVVYFAAPLSASSTPSTLSYSGFNAILAIAVDAAGNLYVLNAVSGGGATYQILVFPPGASGNASPTRTISSPQMTDMGALGQIAVDTGTIFVAQPSGNAVLQFPLGANGTVNATELTGAATGFDKPMYLSVDYLDRLVVLNFANQTLLRFAAGSAGNTAPATTVNISSFDASNDSAGLCLDGQGNEFVPNGSTDAVGFFPSSDTGTASPSRTISGSMTNLEAPDACTVH